MLSMNKIECEMMKYKEIKGTTQEELEKKFPWLKKANFQDAVISISHSDNLICHSGTWKHGVWEGGTWVREDW